MSSVRRNYILLTTDFKPMTGGIAEYLHNLWNEVAVDARVTVLTTVDNQGKRWDRRYDCRPLPPAPLRILGSKLGDSVPVIRKINTARYFYKLRRYAREVVTIIKNSADSPVEVFVGSWWGEVTHFWCEALRNAGIPYSIFTYGMELVFPFNEKVSRWRSQDLSAAEAIFACSSGTAGLIRSRLGLNVPVTAITPGISVASERPDTSHKQQELRTALGLSSSKIVLTVGRLVPRKGVDLVLKAVSSLAAEFPDIVYIVAGDGPDKERLTDLAISLGVTQRVKFLGEVDELTKAALFELCDLFVMPNRLLNGREWEGFGIVFLEAALAGKPSIGGNNGGVSDAIEEGVTGFLVDTDIDELPTITALRRLVQDDDLRLRLGLAARERALTKFPWEVVGQNFRRVLHAEDVNV